MFIHCLFIRKADFRIIFKLAHRVFHIHASFLDTLALLHFFGQYPKL